MFVSSVCRVTETASKAVFVEERNKLPRLAFGSHESLDSRKRSS